MAESWEGRFALRPPFSLMGEKGRNGTHAVFRRSAFRPLSCMPENDITPLTPAITHSSNPSMMPGMSSPGSRFPATAVLLVHRRPGDTFCILLRFTLFTFTAFDVLGLPLLLARICTLVTARHDLSPVLNVLEH